MPVTAEEFIAQHAAEPIDRIAFALQSQPHLDKQAILRQIEGQRRMAKKLPNMVGVEGIHFPSRLSMEQCSGEVAAAYKRDLVARKIGHGVSMADLTGGFGVDFSFLALLFDEAHYVEQQEDLVAVARHNFPLLGLNHASLHLADAAQWLNVAAEQTFVFLDPARRDAAGRKVAGLADCEPNVLDLLPVLRHKTKFAMLKLSPMLDIAACLRDLPMAAEVHVVAEKGECKELLVWLDFSLDTAVANADNVPIVCHDDFTFCFTRVEEKNAPMVGCDCVSAYLYEPSAAVLKAGAFKTLCQRWPVAKLHPESHLYTSAEYVADFPGRKFRVLRQGDFSKKSLRWFVGEVKQANLSVRNFSSSVAALRKRLKVSEGGVEYWFATTLGDGSHVLIACEKVE